MPTRETKQKSHSTKQIETGTEWRKMEKSKKAKLMDWVEVGFCMGWKPMIITGTGGSGSELLWLGLLAVSVKSRKGMSSQVPLTPSRPVDWLALDRNGSQRWRRRQTVAATGNPAIRYQLGELFRFSLSPADSPLSPVDLLARTVPGQCRSMFCNRTRLMSTTVCHETTTSWVDCSNSTPPTTSSQFVMVVFWLSPGYPKTDNKTRNYYDSICLIVSHFQCVRACVWDSSRQ